MEELINYFKTLEDRIATLEKHVAVLQQGFDAIQELRQVLTDHSKELQATLIRNSKLEKQLMEFLAENNSSSEAQRNTVADTEPAVESESEPVVDPEPIVEPDSKKHAMPIQTSLFGSAVSDIRQAISLGDRFLFQRELFGGNGEAMQSALDAINKLSSLDEALAYIRQHFQWDEEQTAFQLFENVLKRRF